jgi:hypothetical protein
MGPATARGVLDGKIGDGHTRRARLVAHVAFDALWRGPGKMMDRDEAYDWLAGELGIPRHECHMRCMDREQCETVIRLANAKLMQSLGIDPTTASDLSDASEALLDRFDPSTLQNEDTATDGECNAE